MIYISISKRKFAFLLLNELEILCVSLISLLADQQANIPANLYAATICVEDNLLVHPGADDSLVVWNMDSQKELGRLVGHDERITTVAARGSLAVSYQDDGPPRLRLWNLEALQCTATLPSIHGLYPACCMEDRVLLGSTVGSIKLWDIAASAPVALPDLEGHTGMLYSIKASGDTVLSGSLDKTVRLWDLRTSKCVRTMEGHTDIVLSVDMDGNCRTAVSGSKDKLVRLWDLGTGRCSATFEGHPDRVRDVVMHESGGNFLSLGGDDCIVNAWDVGSSKAIMRADLKAFSPPGNRVCRLFASRDLSRVAYCCLNTIALELRLWR